MLRINPVFHFQNTQSFQKENKNSKVDITASASTVSLQSYSIVATTSTTTVNVEKEIFSEHTENIVRTTLAMQFPAAS